ncbi:polycomb complex protein BMI-1-like isoform X2 [Mercenaria mercenaria]|uniref:polycomb complex protein BMI-1-like isoform X2 n=1 Tax=Mercenaria mercenaria TaxID=6596 RepID=UPI00234EC50A|nr:polycomb complex protein BMI-1-like isoform X2 [Mercenaria mercenaria]XP_045168081.2 polycomb complex protein BMI-1-like isoform X2 [Mercenaria mercenaria]XP_053373747.1 polycomb complex protein BMI-1-like isoform X2 [Mercenaria mercenaria]
MNRTTRIKITELNPHVICVLCGGYYINATTITECLHSFCRTCITRYLETSKYCPVCDVMVHKTRPLDYIRSDKTLQDLVYKLVPGLYKSEMKRRREYYAVVDSPGVSQPPSEDRGDEFFDRIIYTEDEKISLSLELCAEGVPFKTPINVHGHTGPENIRIKDVRYLQCPAAFSIGNLKKFIRMKFDLKMKFEIDIFHTAEPLPDYYSLMDIAYIYTWTRRAPLRLYYTVFERKLPPKAPDPISRDQSNSVNNNNNRA